MDKSSKRKSIYRLLFFKVTIIVLLLNIILAIITVQDTINIQIKSEQDLRQKIRNEIIGISDFQVSALKTFEKSFYDLQKDALEELTSKNRELRSVNLNEQLRLLGLDSTFHDLYIIEDNIVVNTTYTPDWGLDFSAFGDDRINHLNKILKSKTFYAERFQFESSTKRLKSYSYKSTLDGEFLIEIGSYSEVADKIMEMFVNRLKQITAENENIVSVNYWFGNNDYQFPLIDEPLNRYIPDSLISNSFIQKADQESNFNIKDQELNAEFMYVEQDPSTRLPDFALSIITDVTHKNAPVLKIIMRQALFALSFLILLIGAIFITIRSLKKHQ
ncbi:MAG: hypothetical protein C0597_01605 [Marinilabiliales bacterium]|nr:MAG: hypothetical protein C0597_01605 [Marinilabiliales bacterium]